MDGTEYITLKEAAELSGYSPDYIGQLIRRGKLVGKQVYANVAWVTTREAIESYLSEKGKGKQESVPETTHEAGDDRKTERGEPRYVAAHVAEKEIARARAILDALTKGVLAVALLFLVFLFHILSTVIDDHVAARALRYASSTQASVLP